MTAPSLPPRPPDFEAEVHAFPAGRSPKRLPMPAFYGCPLDLGLDHYNDGWHRFGGDVPLALGSAASASVWLLAPDAQLGRLYVGMTYTLWERGDVGVGRITRVVNPALARRA